MHALPLRTTSSAPADEGFWGGSSDQGQHDLVSQRSQLPT